MPFTPIALFTYNRPDHTRKTLEGLMANAEFSKSPVYIYCDGPKHDKNISSVNAVREVIRSYSLPNVTMIEQPHNLGLANSIITGVTQLCDKYGYVIVVEDDLVVSPFFLDYMNKALTYYKDEERVMQVSGHMFPVELETETDAIFLPFTTTWGWATWQRAWKHFDQNMSGYDQLKTDRLLKQQFDLNGAYPYFEMLERQIKGKIDSWGIRWYLSVFLQGGLTLYPVQTLVQNIGFDGSGTHCRRPNSTTAEQLLTNPVRNLPEVHLDSKLYGQVTKFLAQRHGFLNRLTRKLGIFRRDK